MRYVWVVTLDVIASGKSLRYVSHSGSASVMEGAVHLPSKVRAAWGQAIKLGREASLTAEVRMNVYDLQALDRASAYDLEMAARRSAGEMVESYKLTSS